MTTEWNFKGWYAENGKELNDRRKQRYHNDPEYKSRVLQTNRLSREKKRAVQLKELKETAQSKTVKLPTKSFVDFVNEEDGLITIGGLSRVTGRSVQVLRLWERQGILPEPTAYSRKNNRLYSPEAIASIVSDLKSQGRLGSMDQPQITKKHNVRKVNMKVRLSDGEEKVDEFYSIGYLADTTERTVVTLEQLERRGILPSTPFRTITKTSKNKGHRVYTAPMIATVKNAFSSRIGRLRGEEWNSFTKEVVDGWSASKVIGATVIEMV